MSLAPRRENAKLRKCIVNPLRYGLQTNAEHLPPWSTALGNHQTGPGHSHSLTEEVLFELIKSKCLPILLYGTDVCLMNSADRHSLQFTINKIHTHPFNGPFSGTTRVSRYQKGKTNLDFTEATDSECQWHQLDHMQVCISLQTDNHASIPPLVFYRPDALPAA